MGRVPRWSTCPHRFCSKRSSWNRWTCPGKSRSWKAAGCRAIRHFGAGSLPGLSVRWRPRGWRGGAADRGASSGLDLAEWRVASKPEGGVGVAPEGNERKQFARYVTAHRPKPAGLHVNYNSWWTSPAPFYKESDILKLMGEFEQKLYEPYGSVFRHILHRYGLGRATERSAEIKKDLFPVGFTRIQTAAAKMGSSFGLWISPSACYHDALNPGWARTNLETFNPAGAAGSASQMCCLGGPRYATGFRTRLADLVQRYGIRHVKLDGYRLECPATDHGHAPGALSAGAVTRAASPRSRRCAKCSQRSGWNPPALVVTRARGGCFT